MPKPVMALAAAALTTLTVAAVCSPAPAAAQAAPAPFTGPRIEATIGYDRSHADGVPARIDSVDGLRLGAAAGYDLALAPRVTIGAEAGVGFTLAGATRTTIGNDRYRLTNGRDIEAGLRLGYIVGPSTLLYGKAGWANSEARARVGQRTAKGTDNGVRLGAGVEQMLGDHAYAKAEYRYTAYGDGVSRHQALMGVGYRF